ncbi:hypothetical protein BC629DRAFT_1437672 [Irpex lacteus]|nr:hypothetical protein BC629DRAFT_1437672 [Irpex lacteus]
MSQVATDTTIQTVCVSATVTYVTDSEASDSGGEKTAAVKEISTNVKTVIEQVSDSPVTLLSSEPSQEEDSEDADAGDVSMEQLVMDMVRAGLQSRGPPVKIIAAKSRSNTGTSTNASSNANRAPSTTAERLRNARDTAQSRGPQARRSDPDPVSEGQEPRGSPRRS